MTRSTSCDIDILSENGGENEFSVLAYCLMDNHVHLLIREGKDQIDRVMKRIGVSYVYYFNKKYKRTGHLFQDRFKSEPINDDRYLLTAVRYIHNNPVKALIVQEPHRYQWSSYNAYISKENTGSGITDRDFILKMFSDNEEQAVKQFVKFSKEQAYEEFIDIEEAAETEKIIKNEAEALDYIEKFLREKGQPESGNESMESKVLRNEIIRYLKENSTLTIREIAAIMGINRNTVQRPCKEPDESKNRPLTLLTLTPSQKGVPHEQMLTKKGELVKGTTEDESSAVEMAPSVRQLSNNPFKTPPNNLTSKNDLHLGMGEKG